MRRLVLRLGFGAILYGALALSANPALAAGLNAAQQAEIEALREGDMAKLVVLDRARPRVEDGFLDGEGNPVSLADFEGQVVVLNFWATWCPPCRVEMPSIDRLAGEIGDDVAVVALSTDRGRVDRIESFYREIATVNLKIYQDKTNAVARGAGILGLPVTMILDREGHEIARMIGDAEWDSDTAKAILRRVAEMTKPSES